VNTNGEDRIATVRGTVAANLRDARKRAGLSQAELARRSGVDIQTISRIERSLSDTVIPKLDALSIALGIPLVRLLTGLPELEHM
jgi:transcriptional regulator with XRE-family HTH domain